MKQSMRAKRLSRHHKRMNKTSKLNLVSLMDIFTILVFFLLVNSSDVEVLQNNKEIKLPESIAEQKPELNLVVMVNNSDLMVSGRPLAKVEDILSATATEDDQIAVLRDELKYQIERRPQLTELEKKRGRAVTIMGDQSVPYKLLKRVMVTCAANEYRHISLAVSQVPVDSSAEPSVEPGAEVKDSVAGR
ncbi:biopolymer transporter ExbD [Porticoccus sp. W117]|uniref:ExbD/TolR family protein n=1 Tax=Porticoccus sp. W117 TaxID=3054777 RepID=UPI002592C010|nr:biopolymer transporter ExbD [Porticoccus sp. W117]MDM3872235.1 biopolymer transporter ExbD [Porticoccus sp. W117]